MFVDHTTEVDWALWTDYQMSQADWVIYVCSHSLHAMFHSTSGSDQGIATKHTRFSTRILYNRLFNDAKLKVIPVVLLRGDDNLEFVPPTLRDSKNIFHIYEDIPFCVENMDGDFERLVCRMTGIDRIAIGLNTARHKNQGYVKLQSKIPQC